MFEIRIGIPPHSCGRRPCAKCFLRLNPLAPVIHMKLSSHICWRRGNKIRPRWLAGLAARFHGRERLGLTNQPVPIADACESRLQHCSKT
jgi:hypothetical protein